jgi:hypothetical protein
VSGERGTVALAAALVALAVSAAIGAAVAEVARTELVLAQTRRAAAAALAAADGCLAEGLARLAPGWDFGEVLAGPDDVAGTGDDGSLATPSGCSGDVVTAPGAAATGTRIIMRIDASAGGGRRTLEAVVARGPVPAALLWLASLPAAGSIRGALVLDGIDLAVGAPAWASLAAPAPPETLDAWAASASLTINGGTLPAWSADPPPMAALAARALATPHGDAGTLVTSGAPAPALAYVAGDLTVSTPLRGAGLLFIEGTLDIRAALDFTGLVVASGGVRVVSGASLTVAGAVWIGPTLAVDGTVAVRAAAGAIAAADAFLPLPRRSVVLGQRDLG